MGRSKHIRRGLGLLAFAGVCAVAVSAQGAPTIPVPSPIAIVHTKSGNVERTIPVPLGGVAVPIDVDNGQVLGLLSPDVDVSVGLIAAEELPGRPVVPTVRIARNQLAVARNAPAPPLKIDVTIDILDAGNLSQKLATVSYGYETPPGGRIPPLVKAKLLGPITTGFIDPLEAVIDAPGYEAPLTFNAKAQTQGLDADFKLNFDPLPNRIHFVEDPRDDGLDFRYDHQGPNPDIALTGRAELLDKTSGDKRTIDAKVDRLPPQIGLSYTGQEDGLAVDYTQALATTKPDVEADYRETKGDGSIATDANIKVAGLPAHLGGTLRSTKDAEGNSSLSFADFRVLDGGQIDAVDFLARNWTGAPGGLPEIDRRPDQYVAVASRVNADGSTRYRAAGHIEGVRGVRFERAGEGFDVTTDIGDGVKPLQASLDTDSRGPGADPDKAKRIALDTTVTPLPRQIHVRFEPATDTQPTRVHYDSGVAVDVDADAEIDAGAATGCGEVEVTCAKARIEKLPPALDLALPGEGQTDYTLDHTGSDKPDVRATVDLVDDEAARSWADVRLDDVPRHVLARIAKQPEGVMTAAEFHACDNPFVGDGCPDAQPSGLGSVRFTVRGRPDRQGLPSRPDAAAQHVTLLARDGAFEVEGRVDEIRNVAVHQRATDTDPKVAANLGYLVDTGSGAPFDVKVDSDTADADVPGHRSHTSVDAHVDHLPTRFSGCLRSADPDAQPEDEPDDDLLSPCDRTEVPGFGELDSTPLSVHYDAAQDTKASVAFSSTGPVETEEASGEYADRTTAIDTTINAIPKGVDVDVVAPDEEHPDRKLRVLYRAKDDVAIPRVDVDFQSRGAADVCGDPRPGRATLCLDATLRNLPGRLAFTQNPDPAEGDIEVETSEPDSGTIDIDPIRLQTTSADGGSPLDVSGHIIGLTPHMKATLRSLDPDGEQGEEKPRLAELSFDACPDDDDDECDGIDEIKLDAHNGFFAEALPEPPAQSPAPTHQLSYVGRGEDYRANLLVRRLKRIGYSSLDSQGELSKLTTLTAGLGSQPHESLQAYVDTDDGATRLLVDGRVNDVPKDLVLCMRGALDADGEASDDGGWCEAQAPDKTAIQALVDNPGGQKTDIDLDRIELRQTAGNQLLTGSLDAVDLPGRLQVLAGSGDKPDIDARALEREGGDEDFDAIGRLTFSLRNYEGSVSSSTGNIPFPFKSIDGEDDPLFDARNVDADGGTNYVAAHTDPRRLRIRGSVPQVEHVSMTPDRCKREDGEYDDERFPPASAFANGHAPAYTCVVARAAAGRPLGFSLRTLDDHAKVTSVDGGNVSAMPDHGLSATLATAPDAAKDAPVCSAAAGPDGSGPSPSPTDDGCRPPMLSVVADRGAFDPPPLFSARLSFGPFDLVRDVALARPLDRFSGRLSYEERPADYAADGARVHIGSRAGETAIRAGMRVKLPRYLDLDPPTSFSCLRDTNGDAQPVGNCRAPSPSLGPDANRGAQSSEMEFKLAAAEDHPGGSSTSPLGRVALMQDDLEKGTQLVLTGVPDANGPDGDTPFTPEEPAPPALGTAAYPGEYDLGALLPSHLEVSVRQRELYHSSDDLGTRQSKYLQVDSTTERPLSLGLRLNDAGEMGEARPAGTPNACSELLNNCPQGPIVPPTGLELRNAPGGVDLSHPTFRLRTQMTSAARIPAEVEAAKWDKTRCTVGFSRGYYKDVGFGLSACVITPSPKAKWLTASINAQPDPDQPPARTLDAIVAQGAAITVAPTGDPQQEGLSGGAVDAEIRGWRNVLDGTGSGETADFTAQVGTRLSKFDFGFESGLGVGLLGHYSRYKTYGDLVLGLDALKASRMRPTTIHGRMRLNSQGGPMRVHTDLQARSSTFDLVTILFGLIQIPISSHTNESNSPYRHDLGMYECGTNRTEENDYLGASDDDPKLSIGLQGESGFEVPPPDFWPGSPAFIVFALAQRSMQYWNCVAQQLPGQDEYMAARLPAPPYPEPLRPDTGLPQAFQLGTSKPPDAEGDITLSDIVVGDGDGVAEPSDTVTVCEPLRAVGLTIKSDGLLRAGVQGTTVTKTVEDIDGNQQDLVVPCNGDLDVTAKNITVNPGGRISANASRTAPGRGTPNSGAGGGGAFDTDAGDAGGDVGPAGHGYWEGGTLTDGGSAGRAGTNVAGGGGGGFVSLKATERILIEGTVEADGGAGKPDTAAASCSTAAGGGGSGGGIFMSANYLTVVEDAAIHAHGGDGGASTHGNGGGGGSAGVIQPFGIVRPVDDTGIHADGGDGGASDDCDGGGDAGGGATDEGEQLVRAAFVSLHSPSASGHYKGSLPTVDVRAIDEHQGSVAVHICMQHLAPDVVNASLESNGLNPPQDATDVGEVADGSDGCMIVPNRDDPDDDEDTFDAPTGPGSYEYRDSEVSLAPLLGSSAGDGFYGLYAYAVRTDGTDNEQNFPPRAAQVRFGYDHSDPVLTAEPTNGTEGCFDGSRCVREPLGEADVTATDATSGVKQATCTIDSSPPDVDCATGHHKFPLEQGQGLHFIDGHASDVAGNSGDSDYIARWFYDSVAPSAPEIHIINHGPEHNGWYREKPSVTLQTSDPRPSSGFAAAGMTLRVDGASSDCGLQHDTGIFEAGQTLCVLADDAFIPETGRHDFTASATDKAGNTSTDWSDPVQMRVDTEAPSSKLALVPGVDPASNWYTTRPIVAFGTNDNVGGSGVLPGQDEDPPVDDWGVFFRINNGVEHRWPAEGRETRLPDGVNSVCWYARDIAGNVEDEHCEQGIEVDAATPVASDGLAPAQPNGDDGWYVSAPTISPSATDPGGSGLQSVQQRIDGGPWQVAAPTTIAEGTHTIEVRATDEAGNRSDPTLRTVRVDLTDPTHHYGTHPPAPNARDWFRRQPLVALSSADPGDNSGPAAPRSALDGGAETGYVQPFLVTPGVRALVVRGRDRAGRTGAPGARTLSVDTTPPVPQIGSPPPEPLLLPGSQTTLRFTVSDDLASQVKVRVFVYDTLGQYVRTIDADGGAFRPTGAGSVMWNGTDDYGKGAVLGLYTYRVEAIDMAGNSAISTESKQFLFVLPTLPLLPWPLG